MKAGSMKKIVPIVFIVAFYGGGLVSSFAQEHGGEGHPVEPAAVHNVHEQQTEHQAVNPAAGETDSTHGAAEHAVTAVTAVTEHTEGHDAGHGEHHAPMVTGAKLKDLFWRAVNFAALLIILVKFLARPLAVSLGGRRQQIQDELETLQQQRDEAEQEYRSLESRLAGMEDEIAERIEKAKAGAEDEKARILVEAEAAAKDIRRQAEASVQGAFAQATRKLQAEIADQAVVLAEELIVKNLTPEDQVAITEQYLERLGAVQ